MKTKDFYLPLSYFKALTSISLKELQSIPDINITDEGIPIFKVLEYYYQKSNVTSNIDIENEISIKLATDQQKLIQLILANQQAIGNTILKTEAESRIRTTLMGVSSSIKSAIQVSASEIGGETRKNIEILTKNYNSALKLLYEDSEHVSWQNEGDANLLKAQMKKFAKEAPEYVQHMKDILD